MPQWTRSSVTQTLVLISISSRQKGDIYEHVLPTFSNKTYGKANNDIRIISFLIHILPQKSRLAEHTTNIELKIQVHHFFGSFTIKMFSLSTKYSFGYSCHLFRRRCCLFTHPSFSSLYCTSKFGTVIFRFNIGLCNSWQRRAFNMPQRSVFNCTETLLIPIFNTENYKHCLQI